MYILQYETLKKTFFFLPSLQNEEKKEKKEGKNNEMKWKAAAAAEAEAFSVGFKLSREQSIAIYFCCHSHFISNLHYMKASIKLNSTHPTNSFSFHSHRRISVVSSSLDANNHPQIFIPLCSALLKHFDFPSKLYTLYNERTNDEHSFIPPSLCSLDFPPPNLIPLMKMEKYSFSSHFSHSLSLPSVVRFVLACCLCFIS